jgi:hypothetical protein
MRTSARFILGFFAFFILALASLIWVSNRYTNWAEIQIGSFFVPKGSVADAATMARANWSGNWGFPKTADVFPLPDYLQESLQYLAAAQAPDGGWGAGLHSRQEVQDPHAVATDPATTAMAAMALLRAGSNLHAGVFQLPLQRATQYLLTAVEEASPYDHNITPQQGTQPQRKLGENVDIALAIQYLARLLPHLEQNPALANRCRQALLLGVQMLEAAQQADGSWNKRGWAPVLNSAMVNNALELAQRVGCQIDPAVLQRSRHYQQQNVYADGSVRTDEAAGIPLYALSSTQRATASSANRTRQALAEQLNQQTDTLSRDLALDALHQQGIAGQEAEQMADAYLTNIRAARQVVRDEVQQGFGNNGGEEFVSHLLTSESLAAVGGPEWQHWHARMSSLYADIQNGNGSWSGHHCITSPVFCTAAVVLTLTADREPRALAWG